MSLIVQKFGGTSVATAEKISAAAQRAVQAYHQGHQVVMVVSARGKKTDELVALAKSVSEHPSPREMDMLLATGEQESVALVAMAVMQLGVPAVSLTGGQIGIITDSTHTKARIRRISTDRIRHALEAGKIVIAAGFQGVDDKLDITTLGRGGSDTTATALAAVLDADLCEIYTDVDGVYTTDPRKVPGARKIDHISYDEMLELASLGAGVMHSRSIEFAKKYAVNLRVRPSYSDGEGTLIAPMAEKDAPLVSGVAVVREEARVSLRGIPDRPGVMSRIFLHMAERKIPIDMVVQDVSVGETAEVSFTVPQDELAEALTAAQDAIDEFGMGEVRHGTHVSKISAVGLGMRAHTGVAAHMFRCIADAGVNIQMVTTSDIKISVLVDRDACDKVTEAVHSGFHLDEAQSGLPPVGRIRPADEAVGPQPLQAREALERDVVSKLANMEDIVVSDIELDDTQSLITLGNVEDRPGVAAAIFEAIAEGAVMVDMIVQNVGHDGRTHISFTVPRGDLERSLLLVRAVIDEWPEVDLGYERDIAKLSLTGIGLRSHTDVGRRMYAAISDAEINLKLVNSSEMRLSFVVDAASGEKAKQALIAQFKATADV